MENRLRVMIVAFGLGALVLAGGCARQEAPPAPSDVSVEIESMETTPVAYSKVVDSKEGSAPVLSFREYQVPAMGELEGYGERFATIKYPLQQAGAPTTLTLLDFKTGKVKQAVPSAVNFKKGYNIVGVSGGDRWIAWEELRGEDAIVAADGPSMWKLYVAKIDPGSMTCETPVLVEEGDLETRSRPLFRVEGDALYWLTNNATGGKSADSAGGAIVKARDLTNGYDRRVCETKRHYGTMSVGDGNVIVTEEGSESVRAIVRVFDAVSGDETWSLDLNNTDDMSHFPQVHNGCIAWTVYAPGALSVPDLFYRGLDGVTHRVRNTTSDPIQVGRYIFYDGYNIVKRGSGATNLRIIGGYEPSTNKTFTLIEGDAPDGVDWDMPMGRGYSPDTFVISNDSQPSTATVAEYDTYPMRIRRYTVPTK